MLETLFSNQNIERILLFLFVNQKGYGKQIQSLLNVSLTPLQHALKKLEDGDVIKSSYVKNKRIYTLNSNHPLASELEMLLKKTYSLLSREEKKRYCYIHRPKLPIDKETKRDLFRQKELKQFFRRLSKVGTLSLTTQSKKGADSEIKKGHALVLISSNSSNELIFHEKGSWDLGPMPSLEFTNSFRWTLDSKASLITLEHLRYGVEKPVFLFHLTSNQTKMLESVDPHLCNEDTYLGNAQWDKDKINVNIRVIGPNKNDILSYVYQ